MKTNKILKWTFVLGVWGIVCIGCDVGELSRLKKKCSRWEEEYFQLKEKLSAAEEKINLSNESYSKINKKFEDAESTIYDLKVTIHNQQERDRSTMEKMSQIRNAMENKDKEISVMQLQEKQYKDEIDHYTKTIREHEKTIHRLEKTICDLHQKQTREAKIKVDVKEFVKTRKASLLWKEWAKLKNAPIPIEKTATQEEYDDYRRTMELREDQYKNEIRNLKAILFKFLEPTVHSLPQKQAEEVKIKADIEEFIKTPRAPLLWKDWTKLKNEPIPTEKTAIQEK